MDEDVKVGYLNRIGCRCEIGVNLAVDVKLS